MPELPEVQTVVNELSLELKGQTIQRIEVMSNRGIDLSLNDISEFKIQGVSRRGKYIVFRGEERNIVGHLRMTGKFVFEPSEKDLNHTRCKFHLIDSRILYFIDVRKFGTIELTSDLNEFFKKLGPEPLEKEFNTNYMIEAISNRSKPIKNVLLDQTILAGVGNIYADESLFLSGINPLKKANKLLTEDIERLVDNIKFVLNKSIQNMGTTLSDYRTTKNIGGDNQSYLNVYGLDGLPCKICNSIILRTKLAGRSTHFCPTCQK